MRVGVDGETWFSTDAATMHWTFAQMVAYVSRGEDVWPCDVYGSGTPYGGCGLDQDRWLPRGAIVELRIAGIGTLRNPVGGANRSTQQSRQEPRDAGSKETPTTGETEG
jgi:2-keto-4-pentenoate hydratase/2-oxohepta-3-ene-1,7-dioic acid hydratase in catechol pathway